MPFSGKSLEELKKELKEKDIDWDGVGRSKSVIEKLLFFNFLIFLII